MCHENKRLKYLRFVLKYSTSVTILSDNKPLHMNNDSVTGEIQSTTQISVHTGNVGDQSEGEKQLHHSSV